MKCMRALVVVLVLLFPAAVFAQSQQTSPVLNALMTAFDRGDSSTKLQVLQRSMSQPSDQMLPLYSHALDFMVSTAPGIMKDANLYQAALLTARQIASSGNASELSQLWSLFQSVDDNTLRIALLDDIGIYGKGHAQTVVNLNSWLRDQALSSQAGARPDPQVIKAAVDNLAKIADASSFTVFLHTILAHLSQPITDSAQKGLFGIGGDISALAVAAISKLDLQQWSTAVDYFLQTSPADEATKAKIGAGVLNEAVDYRTTDSGDRQTLRDVRETIAIYLTRHPSKNTVDALIRNFNLTVREYGSNQTTRDRLLEAIAALGASGAEPAAKRLADYMNLLNTYTENGRSFETQIVLAVIGNIKILGYQVGYEPVYYATLLKYSARVQQAANDALGSLQK